MPRERQYKTVLHKMRILPSQSSTSTTVNLLEMEIVSPVLEVSTRRLSGPTVCGVTSLPGDSDAHSALRTAGIKHRGKQLKGHASSHLIYIPLILNSHGILPPAA